MAKTALRRGPGALTGLEASLRELVSFLDGRGIPYMVIGGIANLVWGVPRTTLDIDVTLWAPQREEGLVHELLGRFEPIPSDPLKFLEETRVLPVKVLGFKADLIFGSLPYEERAVRRAKTVELAGCPVRVCTPEDLVVHKIISDRPRDREDARGIVRTTGKRLDRAYLDPIVRGLALDLAKPAIWETYLSCFPS